MERTGQSLIIMQGIPACGKSTWARNEQAKDPEHVIIVSRDGLRHMRGTYWVPKQENFITTIENYMIHEGLRKGYTVIVDATNLNPSAITRFKSMAASHDVPMWGILVHESLETCIERNNNPDREHHINPGIIKNFYDPKYLDYCRNNNIEIKPGTIAEQLLYSPNTEDVE